MMRHPSSFPTPNHRESNRFRPCVFPDKTIHTMWFLRYRKTAVPSCFLRICWYRKSNSTWLWWKIRTCGLAFSDTAVAKRLTNNFSVLGNNLLLSQFNTFRHGCCLLMLCLLLCSYTSNRSMNDVVFFQRLLLLPAVAAFDFCGGSNSDSGVVEIGKRVLV